MILVDTSVWVDYLRGGSEPLAGLLHEGAVVTHPFVIGELACGALRNRGPTLSDLKALPQAIAADHDEALDLLESQRLWGCGIGWIDAHLISSALLSDCPLWTLDRALRRAAKQASAKIFDG